MRKGRVRVRPARLNLISSICLSGVLVGYPPTRGASQEVWGGILGQVARTSLGGGREGDLWDEARLSLGIGALAEYRLSDWTVLRAEVWYTQRGGGGQQYGARTIIDDRLANVTVVFHQVELPLMFGFSLPVSMSPEANVGIRAGPVVAGTLGCQYLVEAVGLSEEYYEPSDGIPCRRSRFGTLEGVPFGGPSRMDVGAAIDGFVEVILPRRTSIAMSVRWQTGLRSVDRYDIPSGLKRRAFSINLALARSF